MAEIAEKMMQFPDAPSAFSWAEEMLSRHAVESQIGKLGRKHGFGDFTMDELRDQALTISKIVARCEPVPARLTFQFVYGRGDNIVIMDLVDAMVRHVYQKVPKAKGKQPHKLTNLVLTVLNGFRRYKQFNVEQQNSALAKAVGMRRQSLDEGGWPELVGESRGALNAWLKISEDALNGELRDVGFVS